MIQKEVVYKYYCMECGYSWSSHQEIFLNGDIVCPKCSNSVKNYESKSSDEEYLCETPKDQNYADNC